MSDIDMDVVLGFVFIIIIIIGIILGLLYWRHVTQLGAYKIECTTDPTQRYAQHCTTKDDCVKQCEQRLFIARNP